MKNPPNKILICEKYSAKSKLPVKASPHNIASRFAKNGNIFCNAIKQHPHSAQCFYIEIN